MKLTRRAFASGGAAFAAAASLPNRSFGQSAPRVRRSINALIKEKSPIIESYRRAVDVMMNRDVTDKTSWWFLANMHDVPEQEQAQHKSLQSYWSQCPHKNYFFLSWHRAYLHFFERIVRKASGDPDFSLPYWGYEDPLQASLPTAFLPDDDELPKKPDDEAPPIMKRRNPLARAKRLLHVERRWIGLGDVAREVKATLALDHFATGDELEAQNAFGGMRTKDPLTPGATGGVEGAPHNLVHKTIGLQGDMGSPETAARDPVFWLHHANVDRLWVKWTDPARGRLPPLDDDVWMNTKFRFVDEDGQDRVLTAAEILDNQFDLGYRYDDEPQRPQKLDLKGPAVAIVPGGPPGGALARGRPPGAASAPVVVARSPQVRLSQRESRIALAAPVGSAQPQGRLAVLPQRLRVVLRNVIASDRTPPYDVFLVLDGASAAPVRVGALDLFGGAGHLGHGQGGRPDVEVIAFEASDALAQLQSAPGFAMDRVRVSIVRRAFQSAVGGEFLPQDPDPPRIGSIELLRS